MFRGFEREVDRGVRRRTAVSLGGAVLLYAAVAAGMVAVARRAPPEAKKEKPVEVVFRKPPPAPPPPPPPPLPPTLRVKKASLAPAMAAPAPPPLVQPTQVSEKKLREADPGQDRGEVARTVGDGRGGGPVEAAPAVAAAPPPAEKPKPTAVNLPEDAEPPEPSDDNLMPEYPEDMREQGIEAQVILKVVITETGQVKDLQVLRGEEPFVGAAKEAVKGWRFTPAKLEGQPIAVYKIIKIPFKLKS